MSRIDRPARHLAAALARNAVIDDAEAGIYRANRRIFTDEEIFELEMTHIFEGNWIYLAHESQLAEPGDYFTTYIGPPAGRDHPRQATASCTALINACAHRGAMICRRKTDNRTTLTCPFHGWTFRNDGTLLKVKDPRRRRLPGHLQHRRLARPDQGRAVRRATAASCSAASTPTSLPLRSTSATPPRCIDMLVDQSPDGLEVLRGSSTYTYDGNWKVQAENGADGYHVTATHWNYAATTSPAQHRRVQERDQGARRRQLGQVRRRLLVVPARPPVPVDLGGQPAGPAAVGPAARSSKEKYGEAKGDFMVKGSRNLCLYPNVYIMDQFSTQIRHFRPIAPDKTEVTIYCIAPKGESAEARARRIRQYEDFFNASGMATPDDLEEFRSCQLTFRATAAPWNDMSRGAEHWLEGPDEVAEDARHGRGVSAGVKNEDEGLYPVQHGYWLQTPCAPRWPPSRPSAPATGRR